MYLQLLTSVPSVRLYYNLKSVFVEIFGEESLAAPWTLQETPSRSVDTPHMPRRRPSVLLVSAMPHCALQQGKINSGA